MSQIGISDKGRGTYSGIYETLSALASIKKLFK